MDLILVPGFWLDGSSWGRVTPALERAGHRVHPLTLPGKESVDADRCGIGLSDHVDVVVAAVDAIDGPVVLVGHSGGGAIAHAVTDRRPDRIARVVYVDAGPLEHGDVINDGLPAVGCDIPLPDWSVLDEEDLVDLTDELRKQFRAMAVPEPARVATDPQELADERRYEVPITVIACEYPSSLYEELIGKDSPYTRELARVRERELVDLPTGHWPQLTRPAELADLILAAVAKA
jgi:pimeloyl-ACP methyl ester carboxylesterase